MLIRMLAYLPPPRDWQVFEDLCWDLWRLIWKDPAAQKNGRQGQPQAGVDIFGRRGGTGGWEGVQCKQKRDGRQLKRPEIETEAEKARGFRPKLKRFFLATTLARDAVAQQAAREIDEAFSVTVFSWDDVLDELQAFPDLVHKYYPQANGPPPGNLHQIPAPPADFTGRKADLQKALAQLKSGAVILAVRGQGGIGKTAFALKLAADLSPSYPDAQIYLDLKGVAEVGDPLTPADVMAHVVSSFNPEARPPPTEAMARAQYLSTLAGRRALILFDNCRDAQQVEDLLPPEGCALLLTSRHRFTVAGLMALDLEILPAAEASKLLAQIAPNLGEDRAAADEVGRLCGCLPLALRLAASTLAERPDWTPASLIKRLRGLPLQSEVESALRLSYNSLSEVHRTYWRSLAVLRGSFDLSAMASVWGLDEEAADEIAGSLLRASVLEFRYARFHLHDLARLFASKEIRDDERSLARRRHAVHYSIVLKKAYELYLCGNEGIYDGLAIFDRERENIEACQRWAAPAEDNHAARIMVSLLDTHAYILDFRLHPTELIGWLDSAIVAARRVGDRRAEGVFLNNKGMAQWNDVRLAVGLYKRALLIAQEVGDQIGEGNALHNLGQAYRELGDCSRAIGFHESALQLTRKIGDREGDSLNLTHLGRAFEDLGGTSKPITLYTEALEIARDIGDLRCESYGLENLARVVSRTGATDQALDLAQKALKISRTIGDRESEGGILEVLGIVYRAAGDRERAIEYLRRALRVNLEVGHSFGECTTLCEIGTFYRESTDFEQAIRYYEEAIALATRLGFLYQEKCGAWYFGLTNEAMGDLTRAVELMQIWVDYQEKIGHQDTEKHKAYVETVRARQGTA